MTKGHIRRRGKTYAVVVELPRDPVTGKRRQRWYSGYTSKKDAQRALTEIQTQLNTGTYVEPSKQTVADYLRDDWLPAIRPTVRPSTWASYKRNLELHVVPYVGGLPLVALDAASLNRLYGQLLDSGRRDRPGGLSPRSVKYVHTIIHRALGDAVRWNRLVRNPADAADPPRGSATTRRTMATWPAATVAQFLDAMKDDRLYAAWYLLVTTGLRRGELLALRWSDIDLDGARVSVTRSLVTVIHEPQYSDPKTARGRRVVKLDAGSVSVLRAHRARQLQEKLALGLGYRDDDLVFCYPDGRALHPERFSRNFDQRVARLGLPRIRLHDLRHTHATLGLEAGVHAKVMSERLGHSSVSITLDVYSHVTPEMDERAAETVAARIFGSSAS